MDHNEIISIFKSYYAEVLKRTKAQIDTDGPLTKARTEHITKQITELDTLIDNECDDEFELLGLEIDTPEEGLVHHSIKPIMEKYELSFEPESKEYSMMKEAYKYALRNYLKDLLTYNQQVTDYSLLQTQSGIAHIDHNKPEYKLEVIISRYMEEEATKNIEGTTLDDKRACLQYLIDSLGGNFSITKIDAEKARYVREMLFKTPISRNTKKATRGLPLKEQIEVCEAQNLDKISNRSIEKYITYFKTLFNWAVELKYINDNPFSSMKVATNKKENRYDYFHKDKIAVMLDELSKGKNGLANTESRYWGTMIAIYTGARRNEIASLLPEDIKKDTDTGIWYFDITDDEETKRLKTGAAKRIVPIHSALLDRGFLKFVEKAKTLKPQPKHKDHTPRLLYDMTFHAKEKWGRNLGRFVNNTFLPKLELKSDKHVLHSLRHSFITYLSVNGAEAKTIKSMVGHEQGTVTFDIYGHFGIEHLPEFKKAIEKLRY